MKKILFFSFIFFSTISGFCQENVIFIINNDKISNIDQFLGCRNTGVFFASTYYRESHETKANIIFYNLVKDSLLFSIDYDEYITPIAFDKDKNLYLYGSYSGIMKLDNNTKVIKKSSEKELNKAVLLDINFLLRDSKSIPIRYAPLSERISKLRNNAQKLKIDYLKNINTNKTSIVLYSHKKKRKELIPYSPQLKKNQFLYKIVSNSYNFGKSRSLVYVNTYDILSDKIFENTELAEKININKIENNIIATTLFDTKKSYNYSGTLRSNQNMQTNKSSSNTREKSYSKPINTTHPYKAIVTLNDNRQLKCYKFRINRIGSVYGDETSPQKNYGIVKIQTNNGFEEINYSKIKRININYMVELDAGTIYYPTSSFNVNILLKSGSIRSGKINLYNICCYDADDILIKIRSQKIKKIDMFY